MMAWKAVLLASAFWFSNVQSQIDTTGVTPRTVVGVVDGHVTLPCDAGAPDPGDKLELVLWYRLGSKLPFYKYDARGRPAGRGQHLADDLLAPRAQARYQLAPPGLALSGLRQLDQGVYVCRADFIQSPSKVGVTNLTLIVPPDTPTIYGSSGTKLADVTPPVPAGQPLSLTCEVSGGRPSPRLRWFWNGQLLDQSFEPTPVGVVRNRLTLARPSRRDLLSPLTCAASNSNLTAPRTATVLLELVLPPLSVQIGRLPRHFRAGATYEVTCTARGSRPAATITWMNGSHRFTEGVQQQPSPDPNVTISVLTLVGRVSGAPMELICQAENSRLPRHQPLQDVRSVPVHYPPQVSLRIGKNLPTEIKEGNDVYFECQVLANPPVTELAWYHQGRRLTDNRKAGIMIHDRSLVLPNVSHSQAGQYMCGATNAEGHNQSQPFRLHVMYIPRCQTERQLVFFLPGRAVELRCRLLAEPGQVRFKWDVNGSATDYERAYLTQFSSSGPVSTLQYRPREEDAIEIRCWGSNAVGLQQQPCIFDLRPADLPGPLQECGVTNSTVTSFSVSCRPGRDGGLTQTFTLEVRELHTSELVRSLTLNHPTFHVRELMPGANFTLQVYATSAKGRGEAATLRVGTVVMMPDRIAYSTAPSAGPVAAVLGGAILVLLLLAVCVIVSLRRRVRAPAALKADPGGEPGEQTELRGNGLPCRDQRSPDLLPSGPGAESYTVTAGLESRVASPDQIRANYKFRHKMDPEDPFAPAEHIISNPMDIYGLFPESRQPTQSLGRPGRDLDPDMSRSRAQPSDAHCRTLPAGGRRPHPRLSHQQSLL